MSAIHTERKSRVQSAIERWSPGERVEAAKVLQASLDLAGRVPPHNEDMEAAVLSAELTDSRVLDEVLAILPNGEPFYSDANRRIHDAIAELHAKSQPVDVQTVAEVLRQRDRLQAVGGISYLVKIADATPFVANVPAHARAVRELWRVRRMIETSQMVAAEGYGDFGTPDAYLVGAAERIAHVADDKIDRQAAAQMFDLMAATMRMYETGAVAGTPTGFRDVDAMTGGVREGELVIVAARPGVGKTSYVMNVAKNVASAAKIPETPDHPTLDGVLVFSLEMPKEQLSARMACTEAKVSMKRFRSQNLFPGEYDRLVAAASDLSQLPIWIDDTPAIDLLELRAKVRHLQREFDRKWPGTDKWKQRIALVIIDYLQLMKGRANAQSREQEINEISRGLKELAKALHVPVIALSQLNRAVETRSTKDKRPQLSDLRDSGAIEQDADMVQFIYRPEMYFTPAELDSDKGRKYRGLAELIIAKQRNGPTGTVRLTFVDEFTKFEDRDQGTWGDDD